MMGYDHRSSVSSPVTASPKPKHRHRHCFTSCFRSSDGNDDHEDPVESPHRARPATRSRCLGFRARHRGRFSSELKYDPLSYALNFDEGSNADSPTGAEQPRPRSFVSRLPASPPRDGGGLTVGGADSPLRFSPI